MDMTVYRTSASSESGLDYFGARYFSGAQGRFTTPDDFLKDSDVRDPQSWNKYVRLDVTTRNPEVVLFTNSQGTGYARNNPLKFTDPTGMDVVLGQCGSGMTASMCQAAPTSGLSKQDRAHVRRVKGDGTNGFKKVQWGLQVDANCRRSSKNFSNLQTAANDHTRTAALNVVAPRTPIATLMGAQEGGQTTVQPFKDAMTAIRPITSGASSTDYSQKDAEHQSNTTDSGKGGVARISTLDPPPKERDSKTGLDYFGRLYSVRKPT